MQPIYLENILSKKYLSFVREVQVRVEDAEHVADVDNLAGNIINQLSALMEKVLVAVNYVTLQSRQC